MNLRIFTLAVFVTTAITLQATIDEQLTDVSATEETNSLYAFFRSQYGKEIITCSMAQVDWNYDKAQYVKTLTGQMPVMNCFDLIHLQYSPSDWINYNDITPVQEWHELGGIVSLMWHWNVPTSEGSNEYTASTDKTTFQASNICHVSGSWEHTIFYQDLWEVYTILKQLQDAGIAVVWRPFHEAAGNIPNGGESWFWWGNGGSTVFKDLWNRMRGYFEDLGIHNLIWVWTSCDEDGDWYPGDDQVDIIGTDIYNKGAVPVKSRFLRLQQRYPNKMIALSECGNVPKLSDMKNDEVFWLWAMPWYGNNNQGTPWATDEWWQDAIESYASGISTTVRDTPSPSTDIYTLDGRRVSSTPSPGIYIRQGRKIIIH